MGVETSILIPYIRLQNIGELVELIYQNANVARTEYEILAEEDTERIGCPKMVARLVEKASGRLIMFIGDDTRPYKGFLSNAIAAMNLLPDGWGLVGLNDLTGRTLPTHWLADRRLLDEIGGEFFHTGYKHCFCDNELMERSISMGRYTYSNDAIVVHNHPLLNNTDWDDDYKRVYSKEVYEHDHALYLNRKQQWN